MWQIKHILIFLLVLCFYSCIQENEELIGYRTTTDNPWEKVNLADSSYNNVIFGLKLGSFHVKAAQPTIKYKKVSVLLDMKNGAYDEVDGDFDMRYFSASSDKQILLPNVKELIQQYPLLKVCVLATDHPSWIEISHLHEDIYKNAYMLYLSKYIDFYEKNNVHIQDLIIPDYNKWGRNSKEELKELQKKGIHIETDITSYPRSFKENTNELDRICSELKVALEKNNPYLGTPLSHLDSPESFKWKKQILKHLYPLADIHSTNLKTEEESNLIVLETDDHRIFCLAWNPLDVPAMIQLKLIEKEYNIQLQPNSINSFFINIE